MGKVVLDIAGRKVSWQISEEMAALIAQSLISSLGPAQDEE